MFEGLCESQDRDPRLPALAPRQEITFMLSSESEDWRVTIRAGRVVSVERGPFVMPSYSFRLVASAAEWAAFLAPVPRPGSHDLFALLRRGVLRFEGDLHPLMAHLLYFKLLLASLRPQAEGVA